MRDRHLSHQPQRQLSRQAQHVEPLADRRKRIDRIRAMGLDPETLRATMHRFRSLTRERLEAEGYLVDPPHKGKEALTSRHRSEAGNSLLQESEDLFDLLSSNPTQLSQRLANRHAPLRSGAPARRLRAVP